MSHALTITEQNLLYKKTEGSSHLSTHRSPVSFWDSGRYTSPGSTAAECADLLEVSALSVYPLWLPQTPKCSGSTPCLFLGKSAAPYVSLLFLFSASEKRKNCFLSPMEKNILRFITWTGALKEVFLMCLAHLNSSTETLDSLQQI